MRYNKLYEMQAKRAAAQGGLDIEAFVEQAVESGMAPEQVQQSLLDDLENDGPIFGKFFRQLGAAAEAAVLAAEQQGFIAKTIGEDKQLLYKTGLSVEEIGNALIEADPERLAAIQDKSADELSLTWVCTLRKTCHVCLPLHGITRTLREWGELGLTPGQVHASMGWASTCLCRFVPFKKAEGREELAAPLMRNKLKTATGLKGPKRTVRGIASKDLERAWAAAEKASETVEGRRTLRLLGQSRAEESSDASWGRKK